MGIRRMAAACVAALGLMVAGLAPAVAWAAGASVSAQVEGGSLNPDGATKVTLSGSGFQSVQGGFGGIYVLFGWVDDPDGGSWRPSQGGVTGQDYRYVPDDESDPAGYDVFVAFPGDSTASAANGGELASDGTWHATLTVPGAKFTAMDRQNNPVEVDCTTVTCGVITIGAHGVVNANNETFTPLAFAASGAAAATASGDEASDGSGASGASGASGGAAAGSETKSGATGASGASGATSDTSDAASGAVPDASAASSDVSDASRPVVGIAGGLLIAAAVIAGLSLVLLAAGVGGYLAVKSLLLGVSPAALEKEIARRERAGEREKARQAVRTAKVRRRAEAKAAKAAHDVAGIVVATDMRDVADGPAAAPAVRVTAGETGAGGVAGDDQRTRVMAPVTPATAAERASTPARPSGPLGFFARHRADGKETA